MKFFEYLVLVITIISVTFCVAAPQPAMVQAPNNWTVDIKFDRLQQIELKGREKPLRFWYMILTLTNNTNNEVDFYPKCELMTDTFQIIPTGKNTPPAVFQQIKLRHQSRYPFLQSLEETSNQILRGQDNAKDIAIIWPDFDPHAKGIKLFISGLSNETAVIDHPTEKDETGHPAKVYLRKTLQLNHSISGDPAFRSTAKLNFQSKNWVMR